MRRLRPAPRSDSALLDPANPARDGHPMSPVERPEAAPRPTRAVTRTPAASAVLPASTGSRRRRRGRRPLLDGPKREVFLMAIRAGNRVSAAATYAGISTTSVHEWLRRGEGRDARAATEPYVSFAREVRQARAHAEVAAVAKIRAAMPRNWRAAAWWLERTNPAWRRPKDRGETTVPVTPPAQPQNLIYISGETLRRLTAEVRAERGESDVEEATQTRGERPVAG